MPRLLAAAAFAAAAALVPAAAFTSSPLYTAYSAGPAECYRQPLLAVIPATAPGAPATLLAFAEGRNGIGWCSGTAWPDTPDFPIVVRRSTDGGATFSPLAVIAQGNLDFLVVIHDPNPAAPATHVVLQAGDTGVVRTTSTDAGATWSPLVNVTIQGVNASALASVVPGVGHGIVISPQHCMDPSCGGTAGRLVLPFVCTLNGPPLNDTACGSCNTCLVVSDDSGATWRLGGVSPQGGSREAALVQLNSADFGTLGGVVYATERNLGNATGTRWHTVSLDSGATFAPTLSAFDAALPDGVTANWTGVVSGAARFDAPGSAGGARVLFTAPASRTERQDLTLFAGANVPGTPTLTWTAAAAPLWAGPAAYSEALTYNATHVAVLFECGTEEFAQQINFGFVTEADVPTPAAA